MGVDQGRGLEAVKYWFGWQYDRVHGVPAEGRASGVTIKIPSIP